MDANTFYSLRLEERLAMVQGAGEFISRIRFYGYMVHLYVLDKALVEVYYNRHNTSIEEVEILDPKDKRMYSYVAGVSLSQLYR